MMEPDDQSQPLYQPTSVERVSILDKDYRPVEGMRVYFCVVGAGEHYVDIPLDQFSVKTAQQHIEKRAVEIAKVLSIEGPMVTVDEYGRPVPVGM